jgi:hypothetical protein
MGRTHALAIAALGALLPCPALAQAQAAVDRPAGFFDRVELVRFTLTSDIKQLRADTADEAPTREATISFRDSAGRTITMPVKVRTHGRWRLTHCEFPPLSITFPPDHVAGTPFEGLSKARLTSYCKDHPAYEQYILQELQLYRIYQLLTPYGHVSRALQVTYVDAANGRTRATRYAFFIDERDAVATRNNAALLKAKGATGSDLEAYHRALMGVFEYMIGNTDFLVSELHNVFLLGTAQGEMIPVPYDFDYAGAVNTAYATPNPALSIRNVRTRLFRGFCADPAEFTKVFTLLNERKKDIYALYDDQIGKLLRLDVATETRKYFDEFYRILNNRELAQLEILSRCLRRE